MRVLPTRGPAPFCLRPHRRPLRRQAARAELRTAKGTRYMPESLIVKQNIGEGSFGVVHEGVLSLPRGEQRIIMKRVKDRVQGAAQIHEMEHLLNVYASQAASKSVADFLGYCEVDESRGKLTRGLWLVWAYQGNRTLAYYLKRRDCLQALATDLGVPEEVVVPRVMRDIFTCLADIHAAGLVHRDVKPANIILCERERRFKLIDLGAACDLRSGTNYRPTETILDPCYCPPEEYVLPTDAPHLSQQFAPVALAMSPLLWSKHRPDCFDTYSAGVILMQLSLSSLRTVTALRNFRGALARAGDDLEEWRARGANTLPARQTVLLDANEEEGWDLAMALLRPREVETDGSGNVKFVSKGGAPRLTASAALRHPFIKRADSKVEGSLSPLASLFVSITGSTASADLDDDLTPAQGSTSGSMSGGSAAGGGGLWAAWGRPAAAASGSRSEPSDAESGGSGGRRGRAAAQRSSKGSSPGSKVEGEAAAPPAPKAPSMWQRLAGKLYDLEARVFAESSATQTQTTKVQQLRAEVAAGRGSEEALRREENVLANMQAGLQASIKELRGLYGMASKFLGGGGGSSTSSGGGSGGATQASAAPAAAEPAAPARPSASRRPKWAAPPSAEEKAAAAAAASAASAPPAAAAGSAPGEEAAAGGGGGLAAMGQAATSMVVAGLKFTGLAMHVASTLAEAVKADAEKALKEAPMQRQATLAYIEALQQLDPPVTSSAMYEDVAGRLQDSEAFEPLDERKRRQVFGTYIGGLRRVEREARQKALAAYQTLLVEAALAPNSSWEAFVERHSQDERFAQLADPGDRLATFAAHCEQLRAAEEAAALKAARQAEEREREARAEVDFRALMQEQEELIRGGATWAQVKRKMWADARFDAIPERRRRELFLEYYNLLAEAGALPAAAAGSAAAGPGGGSGGGVLTTTGDLAAAEEDAQLELLRQEQAKLKEEYDRLEAKLKEMEAQMKAIPLGTTIIEDDGKGNTVFHFSDTVPLPSSPPRGAVNGAAVGSNGSVDH